MLTVMGFIVAACGGGSGGAADEPANGETTAGGGRQGQVETSAGETTAGGVSDAALSKVSEFPPAPRDDENPRFRGSQEMPLEDFVRYVVDDANAKWQGTLAAAGVAYEPSGVVIFDESVAVAEGCGTDETRTVADAAYGPFYCPLDLTVYWPTEFALNGTPIQDYGDFAVAAGVAHEVGHHVQQQLGITDARLNGEVLSIQTELQADCFAGVWGYSTFYEGLIEPGDVDEAITVSQSIGDVPEQPRGGSDAHGSPEERAQAFTLGYDSGDPVRCLDTFTPPPEETTGMTSRSSRGATRQIDPAVGELATETTRGTHEGEIEGRVGVLLSLRHDTAHGSRLYAAKAS